MINIYQLFPRVFGNKSLQMQLDGSIEANGCGKFNDINDAALASIKDMGFTHIWLTGIIRHASLTDYSAYGIPRQHPSLVKGRAGSPYAITDYYDVDPDLAENVPMRMQEFEQLVKRIKTHGMKLLIDFVPNHLAREYQSVMKPEAENDFGTHDISWQSFSPDNNFYYLPGQSFFPPLREEEMYHGDKSYIEQPAKVTGNDCFTASPGLNDWFETVKLNYGVDYGDMLSHHFDPIPDTWLKMRSILKYWLEKGVDGFRTDMSEMVPTAFWQWLISDLRKQFPELLMMAEIYQPGLYRDFINAGFDLLYDKVGLYNSLENILRHGHNAEIISNCWRQTEGINHHMLRFMENHDEMRLASQHFMGTTRAALPAVVVSALMHPGGFMVYNGQELGENAEGAVGYSKDDGKTSIYDYCRMPMHQRWMNNGLFDGGGMLYEQQYLRKYYRKLLRMRLEREAFSKGEFYDLMWANPWFSNFDPQFVYAFFRYTPKQRILVITNFNRLERREVSLKIPLHAQKLSGMLSEGAEQWFAVDLLEEEAEQHTFSLEQLATEGIQLLIPASGSKVFHLQPHNNKTS